MTAGPTGGNQDERGVVPPGQCALRAQLHKILHNY